MADPGSYLAGYVYGLNDGYAARCREESESWQEESAHRVYVSGEFVNRPTSAERLAERQETLIEGHGAGLHHLRRPACPLCMSVVVGVTGACAGCGSHRIDGLPPILHRPDCPVTP